MDDRYLVVVFPLATAQALVDLADSLHAETVELGRSQGTHARRAEDVHAFGHRPEDLLVPHRGDILEVAVDDPDRRGTPARDGVQVALAHRWQVARFVPDRAGRRLIERRPEEDADAHARSARSPGT